MSDVIDRLLRSDGPSGRWLIQTVLDEWLASRPNAVRGRYRRHASRQGNALRALTALGPADTDERTAQEHTAQARTAELAALLVRRHWPDGGSIMHPNFDVLGGLSGTSVRTSDEWVTAAALALPRAAGRTGGLA